MQRLTHSLDPSRPSHLFVLLLLLRLTSIAKFEPEDILLYNAFLTCAPFVCVSALLAHREISTSFYFLVAFDAPVRFVALCTHVWRYSLVIAGFGVAWEGSMVKIDSYL